MKSQKFVIVGGGIGGMTAAIALAQDGHEVEVLEQAPALGAVGAGVTLAPNAMRVFNRLGLQEPLLETGVEPTRQRVQHWQDGRVLLSLERGEEMRARYGAPYLYVHRADLHTVLIKALEDTGRGRVRLSAAGTTAFRANGGAAVELLGGETVEGDVVIAADGVKSPIRRLFEDAEPHFTGHIVWRAVVPVTEGPLDDLASFPGMHIGPGQMAVRYPVSRGKLLNLVFFARQDGWAQEGWAIPGRVSELQALFGAWDEGVQSMLRAIDEAKLFKWAIFARKPLASWVKDGRIALLGDSAHAMTPFLGQGASCAIEDAMILSRCFALSDDPGVALARYERARMERCAFIQEESNANADRIQGDEAHLYGMTKLRNEETLGLFTYDATAVPI